jgi:hypothetical protein
MEKRIVIITGMHRSGTSLFTNYLQKNGLHIGHNLLEGLKGNIKGFFEDIAIMEFHKKILRRTGHSGIIQEETIPPFKVDESDSLEVREHIQRLAANNPFGFKEPRTTLFLDLWNKAIPKEYEKSFILLFRNPDSVVDSLLRRGADPEVTTDPMVGYKCWIVYNTEVLRFYKKNKGLAVLIHIDDFLVKPDDYIKKINKKFNLNFPGLPWKDTFDPKEYRKRPDRVPLPGFTINNIKLFLKARIIYLKLFLLAD